VDIATFQFSYDELREVRKQAIRVDNAESWPPVLPFTGQGVYMAGFPAASRLWLPSHSLSYGLSVASTVVTSTSDKQITCRFEREHWIDVAGLGLPAKGYSLGGISGGPLLMAMDEGDVWNWQLAGIVSQAHTSGDLDFETVVSTPAHFIAFNGSINTWSLPIRSAVPAVISTTDQGSLPNAEH
jgi:hypothetical protein